jgi:phosphotransferase system  glucose/maltose/N-acetylglucosamine-specific IIC component
MTEEEEKQRKKTFGLVLFGFLVGAMVVFGLFFLVYMPTFKMSEEIVTEMKVRHQEAKEQQENISRQGATWLKRAMQEQGYPNVNAFPDGDVLVLVDPHHAPPEAARQILSSDEMRKILRGYGFTTLRVKQSDATSYGPGFDYEIEPVKSSKKGVK